MPESGDPIKRLICRRGMFIRTKAFNGSVYSTGKSSIYSNFNKKVSGDLRSRGGQLIANRTSPSKPALLIGEDPRAFSKCGATINERSYMRTNESLLLKSSDAAKQLGVSTSTLHRWVKAGRIECIQIERNSVYFTPEALDAFIQKHSKLYKPRNVA
jgi:excisionase family DNA binding protein